MTLLNRLDRSLLQMLPLLEHSADALERGLGEAAACLVLGLLLVSLLERTGLDRLFREL